MGGVHGLCCPAHQAFYRHGAQPEDKTAKNQRIIGISEIVRQTCCGRRDIYNIMGLPRQVTHEIAA